MPPSVTSIPLRLTVVRPPRGVALAVQHGRAAASTLIAPAAAGDDGATFDFALRADAGDPPVLTGPVAQGPPAGRFVYVTWGTLAGQPDSPWTRRAKVPLAGITRAMVAEALAAPGRVIAARIAGTGRDGTPSCASVRLLDGGWEVRAADAP